MTKLEVLQGLATFAMSCEANGVDFFYSYSPHVNKVNVMVWDGGKWTEDGGIDFDINIYFEDGDLENKLKSVIETVIDKYYKKG